MRKIGNIIRQPLAPMLIVALVTLLSINLLLMLWSRKLPYANKLHAIQQKQTQDANLLFLGNSLLDHHVDEKQFREAALARGVRYSVVNAALGASQAPEHRLLFDYALRNHPAISQLIVGSYDLQLTEPDRSQVADLTGNRMLGVSHQFPVSEVSAAYDFDWRSLAELIVARSVPMLAYRANVWKPIELLRRHMQTLGMPAVKVNTMGRVDDFAGLEAGSTQTFDRRLEDALASPTLLNQSYSYIFERAAQDKIKPIIVIMPVSPFHFSTFYTRPLWAKYLTALQNEANSRGVEVIDASQWIRDDEGFVDHLHMSASGVEEFSARLGNETAALSDSDPIRFKKNQLALK